MIIVVRYKMMIAAILMVAALLAQEGPPAGKPSLRVRAAQGDPEAQFNLGKNYESGRTGLAKDYTQAAHWYRLSAEQGDPFAMASLGLLYRFGKGVALDRVQAYKWLDLAVRKTSGADAESIAEYRDAVALKMKPMELVEATRLVAEWKPSGKP
jgi:uncharacterized protein